MEGAYAGWGHNMMPEEIVQIADMIESFGMSYMTHPNDNVKIFAASRLVDMEIARRMAIINQRNKETGFKVVGG